MSTYNIQLISQTNSAIVRTLMVAILIPALFFADPQDHELLFFVIMIVTCVGAFLLHLKFVVGKTQWKLDDDGITITWIKKVPFADCKDAHFSWLQIKNVQRRVTRYEDGIKIIFRDGSSVMYYHNGMTGRDDIQKFLEGLDLYCE